MSIDASDPFGLVREEKIRRSRVREIFTPHVPVNSVELFLGRSREVQSLIEQLSTPGQHALLFGDRGVGKSSLANIAAELLLSKLMPGKVIVKRCDSSDTFESVVAKPLEAVGIDLSIVDSTDSREEGGDAKAGIAGFGASIKSTHDTSITRLGLAARASSPSWVSDQISALSGLYLIDEVDALARDEDRKRLAELCKLLSDSRSSLKLLIVGIAETGSVLVAGHPSVSRCLKETRLGRMTDNEMISIIEKGEAKLGLKFTAQAKQRIAKVSSGFAHFVHLLSLKAAEDAIGAGADEITVQSVEAATRRAVNDAEGSLKRAYDSACRSANTDEYKNILFAASHCGADEFTALELRERYGEMFEKEIKQGWLNNFLNRLVSIDGSTVLRRIAKGVYRFSDPRMPSFVRIAAMAEAVSILA